MKAKWQDAFSEGKLFRDVATPTLFVFVRQATKTRIQVQSLAETNESVDQISLRGAGDQKNTRIVATPL